MTDSYCFGSFELQPGQRRLLADGRAIALGPRAFDLLLVLVERAGELVSKEELLQRVWPKLIVEENNLQVQISALRKVLGAQAIVTIPGRGYRFTLGPERTTAEPATVPAGPTSNLPQLLTSFVGRDRELAECGHMLEQVRLLTLTGIGGCGKTRLALQLAGNVLPSFADGVWFVDLAAVAEAERVPVTVATSLGVREESNRPIEDTLTAHLAGKRLLLVLDNCEHLLGACGALAERLLLVAPGLKVLVTSREGLGVTGECLLPVRSMSVPPIDAQDTSALLGSDAVRLFVERARLVAPEFALGPDNASVVGEICRRLDGIPLAIELASARVKLLSVEQIRARLNDRFRLLVGTTRMLSRQQTLLAALTWSYHNLTVTEQQMLRRLSVFADGCTLEAAAAVAGDGGDELSVLEALEGLVDHALIVVDRTMPEPRYRMLDTVRQFAQEQLQQSGEGDAIRERHLTYFLAYAETAAPHLLDSGAIDWTARLDAEQSNLLAAHAWCSAAVAGTERGLRLAAALRTYWLHRGLFSLGRQVYEEALARPQPGQRTLTRAAALFSLALHQYHQWRIREMLAPAAEALAIVREHQDDGWRYRCLFINAVALAWVGEPARALAYAEEAIVVARRTGDESMALGVKGEVLRAQGRFVEALAAFEAALESTGNRQDVNLPLRWLDIARASLALGKLDRARESLAQAMHAGRLFGAPHRTTWTIQCASRLAAACEDWHMAARLQGAADAIVDRVGGVRHGSEDEVSVGLHERAKAMLGPEAYAAAYESGYGLTLDEAFHCTVDWLEAAKPS